MKQDELLKSDAPKTIWLQVGDEPSSYTEANSYGDISWCADKIFDFDIEYRLVEPNTITITESEYAKLKADAVSQPATCQSEPVAWRWKYHINNFDWMYGTLDPSCGKYPPTSIIEPLYIRTQPTSQVLDVRCERLLYLYKNTMDRLVKPIMRFEDWLNEIDKAIDVAMKASK